MVQYSLIAHLYELKKKYHSEGCFIKHCQRIDQLEPGLSSKLSNSVGLGGGAGRLIRFGRFVVPFFREPCVR